MMKVTGSRGGGGTCSWGIYRVRVELSGAGGGGVEKSWVRGRVLEIIKPS
jgi:hypothetical protein